MAQSDPQSFFLTFQRIINSNQNYNFSNNSITCMFGQTGSGKSSLLNYLLNGKMAFDKIGMTYQIRNQIQGKFPKIGLGKNSCTDCAQIFQKKSCLYIDLPGIEDTKGVDQQIVNAYCTANVFKPNYKCKLVIVIEFSSLLASRGGALANVAIRLKQYFKQEFNNISQSCVLVISKVNVSQDSEDNIISQINNIINQNSYLKKGSQHYGLFDKIIQQKRFAFFPLPQFVNSVGLKTIQDKIQSVLFHTLKNNAKISLSHSAKQFCLNHEKQLIQQIENQLKNIASKIKSAYSQNYSTINTITPQLNKLNLALDFIEGQSNASVQTDFIQRLLNLLNISDCSRQISYIQAQIKKINLLKLIDDGCLQGKVQLYQIVKQAIKQCKNNFLLKKQNIQANIQAQRQAEIRRAQIQRKRREHQNYLKRMEDQRIAKQNQLKKQREIKQAQQKRLYQLQLASQRAEQQRIQTEINWLNQQRHDDSDDDNCQIM